MNLDYLRLGLLLGALAFAYASAAQSDAEDPVLNDVANVYTYGAATVGEVLDGAAVDGDAFAVSHDGSTTDGDFATALELAQNAAVSDAAGFSHTISFRYRADEPRAVIFWTTSRELGEYDGDQQLQNDVGEDAGYHVLEATTQYQEFEITLNSPRADGDAPHIVHLQWPAGNAVGTFYIDDIAVVTSEGGCNEDPALNDIANYNAYGDTGFATVADEGAVCDSAFRITYTGAVAADAPFSAGFQVLQDFGADDGPGYQHEVAFRYRADAPRTVIFYAPSRRRGTFSEDDVDFAEGSYFELEATTEWQTFTQTLTSTRQEPGDYHIYTLFPTAASDVPFYLDDITIVTDDGTGGGPLDVCDQPLNDANNYSSFNGNASGLNVEDPAASCESAIAVTFGGDPDAGGPFSEGFQFAEGLSIADVPGNEYRISLRYRGDVVGDTVGLYVPSRKSGTTGGGDEGAFFAQLALTTDYQTLTAEFTSPRTPGEDGQFIYVGFGVGNLATTFYIDSFSIVQTNEPCDEGVLSLPSSFSAFDGSAATIAEVDDADATCGDAIEVCNTGAATPGNDFSQGVQIVDDLRLPDLPGRRFRISLSARASEAFSSGFYVSSRTADGSPDADGVGEIQAAFESVDLTTDYQDIAFEFDSPLTTGQSNRFVHFSLGLGELAGCVYLDDVVFEDITPARSVPTTLYVRPDGSDGNLGVEDSPAGAYETFRFGLSQLIPGDTLVVADGIYREVGLRVTDLQATAEQPTVVRAQNRWGAKIEGSEQFQVLLQVANSDHVVIDGFEVYHPGQTTDDDWATGIQLFQSNYVRVVNNYAHDCGCNGMSGREGDYFTFERNVTVGNAQTSPYNCSGLSIYQPVQLDDADGPHIIIRDNVAFGNECRLAFTPLGFTQPTDGNGIILDDFEQTQDFSGQGNPYDPFRALTLIENNLSFSNGGAGIKTFEVANVIVRNNTTYHNNYVLEEFTGNLGEIGLQTVTGTMEVYNNIAVKGFGQRGNALYFSRDGDSDGDEAVLNADRNIFVGSTQLVSGERNLSDNSLVSEDQQSFPRFADARDTVETFTSVDDFKQYFGLRAGSPALDAGRDPAPATDLNGDVRPVGASIDLGAYEGVVTATGPLPADPRLVAEIERTPVALTIDGVREGFYTSPLQPITKQLVPEAETDVDGEAAWTGVFDDDNLYLYAEVTDDEAQADDVVTFYLDGGNEGATEYDVNDFAFVVTAAGSAPELEEASANLTSDGYAVEVAIPWTTLGVSPADSVRFGIDVTVEDFDGSESAGVLSWQAVTDEAQSNPSVFGQGLLLDVDAPPAIQGTAQGDTIVLDGDRESAWEGVAAYDIAIEVQPSVDSPEDLSGDWQAVWDEENLYFFVEVTDDALVDDSDDWYQDDGIEIYIDADNSKTFNAYDRNDYQIVVEYEGNIYDTKGNLGSGAEAVVIDTETGYNVEVSLPWTALKASPVAGLFIGLDVHVIDDDTGDARDGKLAWFAEIDQSFSNAALFGTAYLGPREGSTAVFTAPTLGDMTLVPNPTAGEVRLLVHSGEPLDVEVVDLAGRRAFARTGVDPRGSLDLSDLAPGTYVLKASGADAQYAQRLVIR